MRPILLLFAGAIGCGRIDFEARTIADAPPSAADAGIDVPQGSAMFVQIQAPGYQSAATASATITHTTGDLLVAAVYWDQAPNTVTLTDNAGLTWTSLPKYEIPTGGCGGPTGNATGAQLYYAQATVTATNTITVSQTSGAQPLGVMVAEYSGLAVANVVELESGQVAPSPSNTPAVPTFTTASTGAIVVFFNETIGSGSITEGAGYTARARDSGFPNMLEDAIVPAGTYMPTSTLPNAQIDACWIATAVALKAR